jgi:serine/threonine protein kinase
LKQQPPHPIAKVERREVKVGDLLGRGGFSEVYAVTAVCLEEEAGQEQMNEQRLARDTLQNCSSFQYVVKHLREDLFSSQERSIFHSAAADLVLEAQFLSRMEHPNIIKLRGWAAGGTACFANGSHDSYFLLLDRLEMTLAYRIEEWQQEQEQQESDCMGNIHAMREKLDIATQLASSLEYLHEHRIVYRDLKADNVGLTNGKRTVQLFDFGLARELPPSNDAFGSSNVQNELFLMSGVGTRRYCAPEVVLGEGYNLQVDVYSMALVIYEMLTQTKPFEVMGPESHRVLVAEGGQRPDLPNAWATELQDLLECGWSAKPFDRPTMKEFRLRLARLKNSDDQISSNEPAPWFRSPLRVLPELIRKISGSEASSSDTSITKKLSTPGCFDS